MQETPTHFSVETALTTESLHIVQQIFSCLQLATKLNYSLNSVVIKLKKSN